MSRGNIIWHIYDIVDLFSAEGWGNKVISYEYADRQEEGYKKNDRGVWKALKAALNMVL